MLSISLDQKVLINHVKEIYVAFYVHVVLTSSHLDVLKLPSLA